MVTIQKYKTNSFLYYSWHVAYLIWGVSFTILPLLTDGPIFACIIGLIPLSVFFWMVFKLNRAEATEEGLILKNLIRKVELDWSEIESSVKLSMFPVAKVNQYKITTVTGKSYRFPLDRQIKRTLGVPLEDSTPMERFITRMIGGSKIATAKTSV